MEKLLRTCTRYLLFNLINVYIYSVPKKFTTIYINPLYMYMYMYRSMLHV